METWIQGFDVLKRKYFPADGDMNDVELLDSQSSSVLELAMEMVETALSIVVEIVFFRMVKL
jgi:hypothetical protein